MRRNIIRDEKGQASILIVIFIGLVAMGFMAMGVDVAQLFYARRIAQSAADSAAMAAAQSIGNNKASSAILLAAEQAAALNGFNYAASSNPAVVSYSNPPTYGNYAGTTSYVEVNVSKPIPTFFLPLLSKSFATVTVAARAVATWKAAAAACICTTSTSGDDIDASNNAKITSTNGCAVVSDSSDSNSLTVVGSASITSSSIATVSTSWTTSNINNSGSTSSSVVTGSAACSTTLPATPTFDESTCVTDPSSGYGTWTVGPSTSTGTACYKGLSIGTNGATVTLNPGTYIIDGGTLNFASAGAKGGTGVFFYLTNGATVNFGGGGTFNLSAPTSGDYSGVLFYQDASDTSTFHIQGGASGTFTGAFLIPGATLEVDNGTTVVLNSAILAKKLIAAGGTTINATPYSGDSAVGGSSVKLVE